jgi:hypothetical protein
MQGWATAARISVGAGEGGGGGGGEQGGGRSDVERLLSRVDLQVVELI